jgi:hypothetical protein
LEEVNEMLARNDEVFLFTELSRALLSLFPGQEFELFQKIDAQLIAEAGGVSGFHLVLLVLYNSRIPARKQIY